uniref:Calcitonin gene-related peptide type 1 receptor n=1 Tax=Monopterus albus TaxID=43700 RepID=A0A3Q3K508_MONAL
SPLTSSAVLSLQRRAAAADTEPVSDASHSPGKSMTEGQSQAVSQGQYKCLELSNKDHPENRTGTFCGLMWDGLLCWHETPAGTSVTQNCPDHPDLVSSEKVTKYCNELGNWVQTGSICQPDATEKLEATEVNTENAGVLEKMISENEKKCLEKMKRNPPYNNSGLHCSRNWDGWLCWDDTPAGTYISQNCPDYFSDWDPTEKATKYCGEDGQWFHQPESSRTWTNYTLCVTTREKKQRVKYIYNYFLITTSVDMVCIGVGKYCKSTWLRIRLLSWLSEISGDKRSKCIIHTVVTYRCAIFECHVFSYSLLLIVLINNYSVCMWMCVTKLKAGAQVSGNTEVESADEATVSPMVNPKEQEIMRNKILDNQYKCFEKMNRDPPNNKSGLYCNRNWDGWLCWDDTLAGTYTSQNCPNYFVDFDPTEKATKYCGEDGQWFRHPDTNRTWSNYTLCNENTKAKLKSAYILFYMAIVGHALSIASLLISLAIFFYFRSLSCQRITLHKNLFCSYVLNSALTIIYLIAVVNNPEVVARNPVGCKVLHFFHMYMLGCNYFWMLCEGIYLHTLIVVAVFAEEQHLHWYYLLGWGFPLVPASIHAMARKKYFDDNCWMSVETHLLYAVHGPIVAALLVNLFFLLNIIRVLVTKLRDTHQAESNMYMKAVRATLILVPLLGIQFVIFPWRPENRLAGEVYEYIMHILMHYQGLLVATIFCFFNGEVQAALKRQWMQYKTQWGQRRKDHCSMRSTSYTATSISEVPVFMYHHDCNSEHLNGRHTEDSELVALRSGEAYA